MKSHVQALLPVDRLMILVYNCTRSVTRPLNSHVFDRAHRFYGESQGLTVKGIISHGF